MNQNPLKSAKFGAVAALLVGAPPAFASDFSGFGTALLAQGLAYGAVGLLIGLGLRVIISGHKLKTWVQSLPPVVSLVLAAAIIMSLGLMPIALAVICVTTLVTWILVGKIRSRDRRDKDAG